MQPQWVSIIYTYIQGMRPEYNLFYKGEIVIIILIHHSMLLSNTDLHESDLIQDYLFP